MNELRGDCRLERVNLRHKKVREHVTNEISSTIQADLLSSCNSFRMADQR